MDGVGGTFLHAQAAAMQLTSHTVLAPVLVAGSKPLSRLEHSTAMRSSVRRKSISPRGHFRAQAPQPMHFSSSTSAQPRSLICTAPNRHAATQAPQATQP